MADEDALHARKRAAEKGGPRVKTSKQTSGTPAMARRAVTAYYHPHNAGKYPFPSVCAEAYGVSERQFLDMKEMMELKGHMARIKNGRTELPKNHLEIVYRNLLTPQEKKDASKVIIF